MKIVLTLLKACSQMRVGTTKVKEATLNKAGILVKVTKMRVMLRKLPTGITLIKTSVKLEGVYTPGNMLLLSILPEIKVQKVMFNTTKRSRIFAPIY